MKLKQRKHISTLDVLVAACEAHTYKTKMTWEILMERTGAPEKVVYSAIEREVKKNFLDWGVSLRTAFLTKLGKQYLQESGATGAGLMYRN